jgi:hypothetical protein
MPHQQRLSGGRALGYVGRGPDEEDWVAAEVRSLEAGCAALGLTLVGVVRDVDRASCPGTQQPGAVTGELGRLGEDDVDCVAVTRLGEDVDLRGVLDGVPVVVLGPPQEGGDRA